MPWPDHIQHIEIIFPDQVIQMRIYQDQSGTCTPVTWTYQHLHFVEDRSRVTYQVISVSHLRELAFFSGKHYPVERSFLSKVSYDQ